MTCGLGESLFGHTGLSGDVVGVFARQYAASSDDGTKWPTHILALSSDSDTILSINHQRH